jgi:uncharacterized cysteine cluster protein YcgN (CxxCxxCC family)
MVDIRQIEDAKERLYRKRKAYIGMENHRWRAFCDGMGQQ